MTSGANPLTLAQDDVLCFGLKPMRNQDNQVEEDYRIAFEKDDPAWYSTCLALVTPGGFVNIAESPYVAPDWQQGETCISCEFQKKIGALNSTIAVDWTTPGAIASTCTDCSIKNSAAPIFDLPLAGKNQAAVGAPYAGPTVSDGSNGSSGVFDTPLYLGLIIAGGVLIVALAAAGIFFASRSCRGRSASQENLKNLNNSQSEYHTGAELTSNPARPSQWSRM